MKHAAALLATLGLVSAHAHAQLRDPAEVVTRHVSTPEGQPLLARNYAMWRSDCTSRGEPVITLTAQPQHGTVSIRPGMATIREHVGDAGGCIGRQVPGMSVWYQPAPGYKGSDQFSLTIAAVHVLRDVIVVSVTGR